MAFSLNQVYFLDDFCKLSKTVSDGTCLGEPPGGFCDVGCCCYFFTLKELFTFPGFFFTGTPPWVLSVAFPSHFYRECYGSELAFFNHRRFYLALLPLIVWHVLLLRCGQEHPIQDLPLCLPSQSCPFRLMHGLELFLL